MTSPPSSTLTQLLNSFVSHEYNDVTGVVTTNIVDGLFAIAASLNRLAASHEKATSLHQQEVDQLHAMFLRTMQRPTTQ